MRKGYRKFNCKTALILLTVLVLVFSPASAVQAGKALPAVQAQVNVNALLAGMTPEEKVGQLFLVTFKGRDVSPQSQIYDLVVNHAVGGVVLTAANNNFVGPENTAQEAQMLISSLQNEAWNAAQSVEGEPPARAYIPLFMGVSQLGGGSPNDDILNGLTPLPNELAIGATWNVQLAEQVGFTMGRELSALGFNLYFGPSLDVLDSVQVESAADTGTQTFGGDPYWVGEMGKAYIQGLHTGSSQLAVIARNFPGGGSADRPTSEEVSTVRKSLEQLKQIELAPFFAVTGGASSSEQTTDGLLVSHIRYQGFQGNIRATTRPVSLDQAALEQLMSLDQFDSWRKNGGVIVSDNLGSPALQKFYSPTGQFYDARQVTLNAFLAGNDLLYTDQILSTNDPDSYTTILNTLQFFANKYREDRAFAQRVDASVSRLLTLKLKLYPDFDFQIVLPQAEDLDNIGNSLEVSFQVAQHAATMISPTAAELSVEIPEPPSQRDKIVFLTDTVGSRQCSTCSEKIELAADEFQKSVLKLYGPDSGGRVAAYNLSSYSFEDLNNLLEGVTVPDEEILQNLENDLRDANWIVFSMLNTQTDRPASLALQHFLASRPDLYGSGKKLIVFALQSPYYLDATDISKLTAYYGLYSRETPFVDVSARILFQEVTPSGALPVSVSGIGYDLISVTAPDPTQIIPLKIDLTQQDAQSTPDPNKAPSFQRGDTIPLVTGMIYDHNHNSVPDGTVVRFLFSVGGESGTLQQIETVTQSGVARATYPIQTSGLLEIRVVSDPAATSDILQLDISPGERAEVTAIVPTAVITEAPTPTPTVTELPLPTDLPEILPTQTARGFQWFLSMLVIWGCALVVFYLGWRMISLRWGMRWGLTAAIGGLLSYLYLSSNLADSNLWLQRSNTGAPAALIMIGILAGWGMGWLWWQWLEQNKYRS